MKGYRKLLVTGVVIAVAALVDIFSDKGLSQNLMMLLSAIIGAYVAGNIGEHMASRKNQDVVIPELPPVQASIDPELTKQIAVLQETMLSIGVGVGYVVDFIKANSTAKKP